MLIKIDEIPINLNNKMIKLKVFPKYYYCKNISLFLKYFSNYYHFNFGKH